jgi:hypothetical protein
MVIGMAFSFSDKADTPNHKAERGAYQTATFWSINGEESEQRQAQ